MIRDGSETEVRESEASRIFFFFNLIGVDAGMIAATEVELTLV